MPMSRKEWSGVIVRDGHTRGPKLTGDGAGSAPHDEVAVDRLGPVSHGKELSPPGFIDPCQGRNVDDNQTTVDDRRQQGRPSQWRRAVVKTAGQGDDGHDS